MASFGDYVDQAAAEVLSRNEILMAAPGSSRISSFYPTPAESTNTIAQAVCNSGQLNVKANSKTFGGASDFQISTSNILDTPMLHMEIKVPALTAGDKLGNPRNVYFGPFAQGWGFSSIETVEVSYSNSNISNLKFDGKALLDASLLQCSSEEEKQEVLAAAGKFQVLDRSVDRVFKAAVPISFLNWRSAGGIREGFPIDGRALNGPIQFQFKFRPLQEFMGDFLSGDVYDQDVPGVVSHKISNPPPNGKFPTGFSDLSMTFRTYQLMDGAFSVSKALMANPGMIYSIPSLWMNSYNYSVNLIGGRGSIQLNSAPAGMVQAILINVQPITETGFTAESGTSHTYSVDKLGYTAVDIAGLPNVDGSRIKTVPRHSSAPINYLRLQYSGQTIFLAESSEQLDLFYKQIYGNDLKVYVPTINNARCVVTTEYGYTANPHSGAGKTKNTSILTTNYPDAQKMYLEHQSYNIPLMHDGRRVFCETGFENLPHYSGSTLSLDFGIEDQPRCKYGITNAGAGVSADDILTDKLSDRPTISESNGGNCFGHRDLPSEDYQGGAGMTQMVTGNPTMAATVDTENTTDPNRYNTGVSWGTKFYNGASGQSRATVTVTYVISALLQSTNGIVELQL